MIIVKPKKIQVFVGKFNAVQVLTLLFCQKCEQSILLAWRISSSKSCNLFVFVGRFSFTIVPSQGTSSSVSVKCLLSANGTRHRLKFFFNVRNWFCCLPTENAACKQFSSTKCHIQISKDFAVTFNCPSAVMDQLIMNLKPSIFWHQLNYIRERYQTVFDWELRAP